MGMLRVEIGLANPLQPAREARVEALVDTGALYSIIPASRLKELGIEPQERQLFRLADGREIEREVGVARFGYNGRMGVSKVVFGEGGDATVLGVVALEELGLEVDPIKGELRPATLFLFLARPQRKSSAFEVACPHCGAKLTLDAQMGAVLEHQPPKKTDYDFDQQLKGLSQAERKREELFRQQMAAEKDRSKLLERKFEESLKKRKGEPIEKPLRDIDLD
ncbi:MAG: aspartyl protease family protein [Terriglobia bacterium]